MPFFKLKIEIFSFFSKTIVMLYFYFLLIPISTQYISVLRFTYWGKVSLISINLFQRPRQRSPPLPDTQATAQQVANIRHSISADFRAYIVPLYPSLLACFMVLINRSNPPLQRVFTACRISFQKKSCALSKMAIFHSRKISSYDERNSNWLFICNADL